MRTSTNLSKTDTIVEQWLENKINRIEYDFSCGGDSMNDTSIQIFDDKGSEIDCVEIRDYIDDVIYHKVEFYEASDGNYMGEAGNVEIRLSDDEEELEFSKSSQSEWCERVSSDMEVLLDEKEVQFAKNHHFMSVHLGENRLRTETAGIFAAQCLILRNKI